MEQLRVPQRSIGLDVHPTTVYVTLLDPSTERFEQYEFPMEPRAFEAFLGSLRPGDRVALEATGNTWLLHRQIKEVVDDVVVAETTQLKRLLGNGRKTDRNDSMVIAYLAYIGGLPTVWVPDPDTQHAREFLQYRTGLVKDQTRWMNRIRALFPKYGLACPASDLQSKDGQLFLVKAQSLLPWYAQEQLATMMEQLDILGKSLERAAAIAEKMAEKRGTEAELLSTIPGVDSLLAVTILACIGNINRFPTPASLANYAGVVPSVHSSGKKRRHGSITKKGSRMLRWAVTQAIQSLRNVPGPFRNLYRRLSRGDKAGRAVVACARKLLVVIWHMLRNGEAFRGVEPEKLARKDARRKNRRLKANVTLAGSKARHHEALVGNLALLRELALRKESNAALPEQLLAYLRPGIESDQLLRMKTRKPAPR